MLLFPSLENISCKGPQTVACGPSVLHWAVGARLQNRASKRVGSREKNDSTAGLGSYLSLRNRSKDSTNYITMVLYKFPVIFRWLMGKAVVSYED